jgi:hypothetical protein
MRVSTVDSCFSWGQLFCCLTLQRTPTFFDEADLNNAVEWALEKRKVTGNYSWELYVLKKRRDWMGTFGIIGPS